MTTDSTKSEPLDYPKPVTIPIVYGTASIPLDPKDSETEQRWCVFLIHPDLQPLTPFVHSVTFLLHDSFDRPKRVLY